MSPAVGIMRSAPTTKSPGDDDDGSTPSPHPTAGSISDGLTLRRAKYERTRQPHLHTGLCWSNSSGTFAIECTGNKWPWPLRRAFRRVCSRTWRVFTTFKEMARLVEFGVAPGIVQQGAPQSGPGHPQIVVNAVGPNNQIGNNQANEDIKKYQDFIDLDVEITYETAKELLMELAIMELAHRLIACLYEGHLQGVLEELFVGLLSAALHLGALQSRTSRCLRFNHLMVVEVADPMIRLG
ncbi:hypothetical protein BV898_11247 [Hypsibius exemplaris]|uniref:Uncharacterized protein n=1 Tax=Hypsibius exemplaris TaxID=2072580 RepID=A0A1W0WH44_HYPEX|nr:hypothetical protein BV898_11247 [Hypsibius exemplaris]